MPDLPARPDIEQLRHRAKDLLRSAKNGDAEAIAQIQSLADRLSLGSAQLAVAREHGFPSWPKLKTEVDRRRLLNDRDLSGLRAMIAEQPALALSRMEHWCDHRGGPTPLSYIAMLRFDAPRLGLRGPLPHTGEVARLLLAAGASVDGLPGEKETPLITAASYGDADVARTLAEAGADLEAHAAPNAGGVPGGTALLHAAVFGMTEVIDVLVAAGAEVHSLEEAAAAGDVSRWPLARSTEQSRIRALVMAADHQRLEVIDRLIDAGTPVDAEDAKWGRQALRLAAQNGRPASVRRLLERGADANLRDSRRHWTALEWCRESRPEGRPSPGHDEVDAILQPLTTPSSHTALDPAG